MPTIQTIGNGALKCEYTADEIKKVIGGQMNVSMLAREEEHDPVNRPAHYTKHPSGVECIQITEHMNFNLGNAVKYFWRADLKFNAMEDLKKAKFYIEREIVRRTKARIRNAEPTA